MSIAGETRAAEPSVSVVIPVFNGARTISFAIQSVLAQRYAGPLELIVVDDGSTDALADTLSRFADVKLLRQENRGQAVARNAGVAASSGELIAFLDADDAWLPGKLAACVAALEEHRECVMAYSDAHQADSSGAVLEGHYLPPAERRAPALEDLLAGLWNILPSTVVVRRDAFAQAGGFPNRSHGLFGEDALFHLLLRERGPFWFIEQPLVQYRRSRPSEIAERHAARASALGSTRNDDQLVAAMLSDHALFASSAQARFGARARGLLAAIRRRKIAWLEGRGLAAMAARDRTRARHYYALALRIAPARIRLYLRWLWTLLPAPILSPLARALPERLNRSLAGPPVG